MFDHITKDPNNPFFGAEIVSVYTRQQAIADGVLVDVTPLVPSEWSGLPAFNTSVCFTADLWSRINTDFAVWGRERARRILRGAARSLDGDTDEYFAVSIDVGSFSLRAVLDGDGLTIGFPGDF